MLIVVNARHSALTTPVQIARSYPVGRFGSGESEYTWPLLSTHFILSISRVTRKIEWFSSARTSGSPPPAFSHMWYNGLPLTKPLTHSQWPWYYRKEISFIGSVLCEKLCAQSTIREEHKKQKDELTQPRPRTRCPYKASPSLSPPSRAFPIQPTDSSTSYRSQLPTSSTGSSAGYCSGSQPTLIQTSLPHHPFIHTSHPSFQPPPSPPHGSTNHLPYQWLQVQAQTYSFPSAFHSLPIPSKFFVAAATGECVYVDFTELLYAIEVDSGEEPVCVHMVEEEHLALTKQPKKKAITSFWVKCFSAYANTLCPPIIM